MKFLLKSLLKLLLIAATVIAITIIVPGVHVVSFAVALLVAIVWGLVALFVRPILFLLTLPINLLTLGLFTFVLNALLFWLVAAVVPGFTVSGFIPALEGSVLLTIVSWVLHAALK